MTNYLLRKIDAEMWERAKSKSDSNGMSLRGVILTLLQGYVDGRIVIQAVRTD